MNENLPQNTGEQANNKAVSSPSQILTLFHQQAPQFEDDFKQCEITTKKHKASICAKKWCEIVLVARTSRTITEIQKRTDVKSHNTVIKALKRFLGLELEGLKGHAAISDEKHRSGRHRKVMTLERVARLNSFVRNGTKAAAEQLKAMGQCSDTLYDRLMSIPNWSYTSLAKCLDVSRETVRTYCKETKLKINAQGSHCFSFDPNYEDKAIQVHNTYTSEIGSRTKVLCLDEKTCIQALMYVRYRIYNGEMYKSCRYTRLGCVHLIAAFDQRTGQVYFDLLEVKNRYGIRAFIENLPAKHPELRGCFIKFILDNLAAHKNFGEKWYARHPNFDFIFTPTCASWLNQVESFFGILSRYVLAGRSIESRDQLALDITNFINYYNRELKKRFKWDFNIAHHLDQRVLDLSSFAAVGFDKASTAFVASYRRLVGLHDKDSPLGEIDLGILQEKAKRPPMEILF